MLPGHRVLHTRTVHSDTPGIDLTHLQKITAEIIAKLTRGRLASDVRMAKQKARRSVLPNPSVFRLCTHTRTQAGTHMK